MRYRLFSLLLALGVLVLAGCGGRQNPVRLDTSPTNPFFNGLWDGFTVVVVFVKDITSRTDYQYYAHGATGIYFLGYLLGILLLLAVLQRLWWAGRKFR